MKRFFACLTLSAAMIGGLSSPLFAQENDAENERLEDAQRRLEEAAREIAEISGKLAMDGVNEVVRQIRIGPDQGAVLGVYIGCLNDDGVSRGCPEEGDRDGVKIAGVTPGGPADDAGLKAGDIIVSLNDQSVEKDSRRASFDELSRLMDEVEPGDKVSVRYMREGNERTADVVTGEVNPYAFAFSFDDDDFDFNFDLGDIPGFHGDHWNLRLGRWSDIEMVALTPRLGEYFGTEEGLLVVRAPGDDELQLEDGDVIISIDGRTPKSPEHAMRILRSYQSGEELQIDIVRSKKKRTLNIEVPGGKSEASIRSPAGFKIFRAPRAPRVQTGKAIET